MGPPDESKKEFEEELRQHSPNGYGSSITIFANGNSITLSEKRHSTKQRTKRIGFSPYQSPWNRPPITKYTTVTPKPLTTIEWRNKDPVVWDFTTQRHKIVYAEVTPPPFTVSMHTDTLILRAAIALVGLVLALFVIFKLMGKKNRTRRGVVLAVRADAVEQNPQTHRTTPSKSGEAGPQTNDLPPPYQECMLYSMNEDVGNVSGPYTGQEHQIQRPDIFIEKERTACSGNNAPKMRTELVFDCGRVVERLSLDANSKTNKPVACGQSTHKK